MGQGILMSGGADIDFMIHGRQSGLRQRMSVF